MDRIVEHWLERSNYDLGTAKAMLDAGRYLYVAYMCQQSIEKALKALIAKKGKENYPIHNLIRLTEIASIRNELNEKQFNFLTELTPYHIEARYGDYKESLTEIINEKKAIKLYQDTRELFNWLCPKIK